MMTVRLGEEEDRFGVKWTMWTAKTGAMWLVDIQRVNVFGCIA